MGGETSVPDATKIIRLPVLCPSRTSGDVRSCAGIGGQADIRRALVLAPRVISIRTRALRRSNARDEGVGRCPQRIALLGQVHCRLEDVVGGSAGIGGGLAHAADIQENLAGALGSLVGIDACGQTILSCFAKLAHHRFDPLAGLALAEYHFGKTATALTIQIDMSKAEVIERYGLGALRTDLGLPDTAG